MFNKLERISKSLKILCFFKNIWDFAGRSYGLPVSIIDAMMFLPDNTWQKTSVEFGNLRALVLLIGK
jgi:hypothetical protein